VRKTHPQSQVKTSDDRTNSFHDILHNSGTQYSYFSEIKY